MDNNRAFVDMVKKTTEILESKIIEQINKNTKPVPTNMVGVHLFVMVHGLQGNHGDMRLFRNQISL